MRIDEDRMLKGGERGQRQLRDRRKMGKRRKAQIRIRIRKPPGKAREI